MGQDPDAIRQQIEQTRSEMTDTVEAIGYKADVKSRAKESISDKADNIKSKITGAGSSVNEATPGTEDIKQGARQAVGVAQENPLGLAVGAAAVGFIAGMLIPGTRVEDQRLGPMADQLKDKVRETGQEALEHGKEVAQEVAQSAKETAQQAGQEHGQQLADSARQNAQEAAPTGSPA